ISRDNAKNTLFLQMTS
nr:immunoglobulin heavy chain junction region [Mus musculus]